MSTKKKRKKKQIQKVKKKIKKKKIKKKSSKKKTSLKSSKKVANKPKRKKPLKKTKKEEKIVEEEKTIKPKINIPVLFFVIFIAGIVIYSIFCIYKVQKEEYNRLTNYIVQSNLSNYEVKFEDNKGDSSDWQNITSSPLVETYARNKTIYIKDTNENSEQTFTNKDYYFNYLGDDYYLLPSDGKYIIDYIYYNGDSSKSLSFISDNDSVNIEDNIITCNKSGKTTIYATFGDEKIKLLDIKASTLIIERVKEFDDKKPFLTCEQYTKEENDELDEILEEKINKAGYLTRAGVVEALRFMTLDLPYRVNYFYENGRLPNVDGEGRYYHKGLYLSSDRYQYITTKQRNILGTWGCKIYSIPYEGKTENGLDCSGLIGWSMYNAGYDPNDIKGSELLLELGDVVSSKQAVDSGKIKVGDCVHNYEAGGHIGMIIGIDDTNEEKIYYVAQSIWYKPNGVCISKYTEKKFINHWKEVGLMDVYYKNDGNLTNMWY